VDKFKEKNKQYKIGLDMGVASSGWAVSDENGDLLKFKHQPMWGVRLFNEGETAESRRNFRTTRRRLARRIQRGKWLRSILGPEIEKMDPDFFKRMKYSSWSSRDAERNEIGELFDNGAYCSGFYQKAFPTIFHLRKELATNPEKKDLRLVYLALHHIVKYRGNFLYDGEMSIHEGINLASILDDFFASSNQEESVSPEKFSSIKDTILKVVKDQACDKQQEIYNVMQRLLGDDSKKYCMEFAKAILGKKADFSILFPVTGAEEENKFKLSDEEKCDEFSSSLDGRLLTSFQLLKKIHSAYLLASILSAKITTLSDVYINYYESYKKDLHILKHLLKKYCAPDVYHTMFYGTNTKDATYAKYQKNNSGNSSYDELMKKIKDILKKIDDPEAEIDKQYCLSRIKDGSFLRKPKNNNNGAIPHQLQVEELKEILEKQKKYYPVLAENEMKIIQIASFRIPYYVGPLSTAATQYGWAVRKENGPVTPWNYSEKIDVMSSAEQFINNLTNSCQYLYGEDVIPKNSLLFSEYCLLNELNGIRMNGYRLGADVKQRLLTELFTRTKHVTKSTICKCLFQNGFAKQERGLDITGFQKKNEFASSLSSFIDFTSIFGNVNEKNQEMIENCILWITLFSDKSILRMKIKKNYPELSSETVTAICKLNYQGWGRFSRKLLVGIKTMNAEGELLSVMDILRTTNLTFMEILYDRRFSFQEIIEKENAPKQKDISLSRYDSVFPDTPISPSVKKTTWQGLKVIQEIVKIMGKEPKQIYIEFTRSEGKKGKRTINRYDALEKMYKRIKDNPDFQKCWDELTSEKEQYKEQNGPLSKMKLFLYFLQNGKCLYTEQHLEISNLNQYQIDHILPQAYIKDNSIDNLALVIQKENQRKKDSLLLNEDIITKETPYWDTLKKNGLLSTKKYNALIRTDVPDEEFDSFVSRQIVETSQAIKLMSGILKKVYPSTNIVGVKAGLSHDFRIANGLYKIRELNDYHHAHDAYIACQVGMFLTGQYGQIQKMENVKRDFFVAVANQHDELLNFKEGFVAWSMSRDYGNWCGSQVVAKVRKTLRYHQYFISRKTEESSGAFYNQKMLPVGEKEKTTVPSKEGRDPLIYGGYSGEQLAYFDIIEFMKGKKKVSKLVGIPIRITALERTKPDSIKKYLNDNYPGARILKERICKYQYVLYHEKDGTVNEYYIVSDGEVINARELLLPWRYVANLASFDKLDEIGKQELFQVLCAKMKEYPCYMKHAVILEKHVGDFGNLSSDWQKKCIRGLLCYMQANSSRFDFSDKKGLNWNDVPTNRLQFILNPEFIEFVDKSVTGMFERRYQIGV